VIAPGRVADRVFPPQQQAMAKAIACQPPKRRNDPFSRYSLPEIGNILMTEGIVETISVPTLCRWFATDAIKPWRYQNWIFPRDPRFLDLATVVLDLYQGFWQGIPLTADDLIVCADEKSGLQVLQRTYPIQWPIPRGLTKVEFEYKRHGTLVYQAALDVRQGTIIGQIVKKNEIATFNQLVKKAMEMPPYNKARRVFWIVDNGGCHHKNTFPSRLKQMYPNAIAVHLPTHASWLNQIELYFSILQRKALTPRDFAGPTEMEARILDFEQRYNENPKPFNWKFTATDLQKRIQLF
jgi:hypothetical protein